MPRTPIDYTKTIIYKITKYDEEDVTNIYIGHTTDFTTRKSDHKRFCYASHTNKYNYKIYQYIRNNGGWDNFNMIEIEKYPCTDGNEARAREEQVRVELGAKLNSISAYRTTEYKREYDKEHQQIYRENNKQDLKDKAKIYRENNKDKLTEKANIFRENNKDYNKIYYENNKDKISEKATIYRENNKDKIADMKKIYRENNKDKLVDTKKIYRENNKDKIAEKAKIYNKKRKDQKDFIRLIYIPLLLD